MRESGVKKKQLRKLLEYCSVTVNACLWNILLKLYGQKINKMQTEKGNRERRV